VAVAMKICPCSLVEEKREERRRKRGEREEQPIPPRHSHPFPLTIEPLPLPLLSAPASHHIKRTSEELRGVSLLSCCSLATPLQQTKPRPHRPPPFLPR